jgi:hypothetical protein
LDRGTKRPGDQPRWLTSRTSTSASVHESDRVDRVKTTDARVERGSGRLGRRPVEDNGDTCRVTGDAYRVRYSQRFGGLDLKTIGGWVYGFGSQNLGGGSEEERMARGGTEEFASRRSYLMKGTVAVG